MQYGAATLGNGLTASQKVKHKYIVNLAISFLGIYPRKKHFHPNTRTQIFIGLFKEPNVHQLVNEQTRHGIGTQQITTW